MYTYGIIFAHLFSAVAPPRHHGHFTVLISPCSTRRPDPAVLNSPRRFHRSWLTAPPHFRVDFTAPSSLHHHTAASTSPHPTHCTPAPPHSTHHTTTPPRRFHCVQLTTPLHSTYCAPLIHTRKGTNMIRSDVVVTTYVCTSNQK